MPLMSELERSRIESSIQWYRKEERTWQLILSLAAPMEILIGYLVLDAWYAGNTFSIIVLGTSFLWGLYQYTSCLIMVLEFRARRRKLHEYASTY